MRQHDIKSVSKHNASQAQNWQAYLRIIQGNLVGRADADQLLMDPRQLFFTAIENLQRRQQVHEES